MLALSSVYLGQKPAALTLLRGESCELLAAGEGQNLQEGLSGGTPRAPARARPRDSSQPKRRTRLPVCRGHLQGCFQSSWVDVDIFRKAAAFAGKPLSGLPGGPAACPRDIPAAGRCETASSSCTGRFKVYAELRVHLDFFQMV